MIGIIGSNGLVGSYLKNLVEYDHEFNSNNIQDIKDINFDRIYISAPTGNRPTVNADPTADLENIHWLIDCLQTASIKTIILIGTVDSVIRNHLPYGSNRLYLENQIKHLYEDTYILRLSSLIHKNITKNMLYDLKHTQYLNKINVESSLQWYDLNNLITDIEFSLDNNLRERNLVSEPIYNKEIVDKFFPKLVLTGTQVTTQCMEPICYSKTDIFNSIEKYLNETV